MGGLAKAMSLALTPLEKIEPGKNRQRIKYKRFDIANYQLPLYETFGEWKVIGPSFREPSTKVKGQRRARVPVRCSCGFETDIRYDHLMNKNQSNACRSCTRKNK